MVRRQLCTVLLSLSFFIILTACGGGGGNSESEGEYDSTKKMVVDILQTEDGKKALREIMHDEELKNLLVMESDTVKNAVNEALTSEESKKSWEKMFEDPEFVKTYAQSISDEQKNLMKDLMNDSQFQKQMIELLNNPEVTEQMLSVVKSQQFRAHLEETIQQTLQSPIFQAKIEEILLKAAQEQSKSSGSSSESGQGSQSGESQSDSGSSDSGN